MFIMATDQQHGTKHFINSKLVEVLTVVDTNVAFAHIGGTNYIIDTFDFKKIMKDNI